MKPVAWMSEYGQFIGKVKDEICHIPLYTAPRELSDEEIEQVWKSLNKPQASTIEFARAILKKASEK